jgi:hypothetical protein
MNVKTKSSENSKIICKEEVRIFDVDYIHIKLNNDDELYLTKYGVPFIENLMPNNFLTDNDWYQNNSEGLSGSSGLRKIRTKSINGKAIDIVFKWNRMGQDVPGENPSEDFYLGEFNSPFEEFSLVMELRDTRHESPEAIFTHKPLAIYIPSKKIKLESILRKEYKMKVKINVHDEVELDMYRNYAVIYEWLKGIDAARAYKGNMLEENVVRNLTSGNVQKLEKNGFVVGDNKPSHIIIRPKKNGDYLKNKNREILYGLVDFELLARTPEREEIIRTRKRMNYLKKQKDKLKIQTPKNIPSHLKLVEILGVNYIFGHAETTNGLLWVVGKDPDLFDYFLPERWENTLKTKLSLFNNIYYTLTKDNVHIVWKVSSVGTIPDMDPFKEEQRKIIDYGYNSPFEEVSIAFDLSNKGIRTVLPRAIYMYGDKCKISDSLFDPGRFETHKKYKNPDGFPLLQKDHNYINIYGYWLGLDETLADKDENYLIGINTLRACREGIISQDEYISLLKRKEERLKKIGYEDLNFQGRNILLSLDYRGKLVKDKDGLPETRICNFELLRRKDA